MVLVEHVSDSPSCKKCIYRLGLVPREMRPHGGRTVGKGNGRPASLLKTTVSCHGEPAASPTSLGPARDPVMVILEIIRTIRVLVLMNDNLHACERATEGIRYRVRVQYRTGNDYILVRYGTVPVADYMFTYSYYVCTRTVRRYSPLPPPCQSGGYLYNSRLLVHFAGTERSP